MTEKELEFWKKAGVIPKHFKFGDMCYGLILTEVKMMKVKS